MGSTPRLALPFLSPGQAQKELYHNEALQLLDILVAAAVEEPPRNSPPVPPAVGSCYLVGSAPTGEWAGKQHRLAAYSSGGWRYVGPVEGLVVHVRSTGTWGTYRTGAWEFEILRGSSLVLGGQQVVGTRRPAIIAPTGGAVVDAEARAAINQLLATVRDHGLIET